MTLRLAHVANFYGPRSGGLRTTMHELGRGYREAGHEVLHIVPGDCESYEDFPWGTRITVNSRVLPASGGYRVVTDTTRVTEMLRRWAPDRLEVSDRTTLRGLGGWAAQQGIPSVAWLHERVDGVLAAWHAPTRATRRAADAWNRGLVSRFDRLVATTSYAAGEIERLGVRPDLVALGTDLAMFHPSRFDESVRAEFARPDEHLLVMASRLSREKRPEIAIDAVRELRAAGLPVRLVVAGAGPLAEALQRKSWALPIEFVGFVDGRERLASLLACADVVLAPGPIETFGLAALESLAAGSPVVCSNTSALPEVVAPGTDSGRAANPDGASFAAAVTELLEVPVERRRQAARERAECFPWSRTVHQMLALHGAIPASRAA